MKRTLYVYPLIFLAFLFNSHQAFPQGYKTFKTDYTTIHYSEDAQLDDFLWKIGRLRFDRSGGSFLAKNRVDRIVERVESVLDMHPESFHIDIILCSDYKEGEIASYYNDAKSITVFVERTTDGVLAHEIAHAVINAYFKTPPPSKLQEILCRYADVQLWRDYD